MIPFVFISVFFYVPLQCLLFLSGNVPVLLLISLIVLVLLLLVSRWMRWRYFIRYRKKQAAVYHELLHKFQQLTGKDKTIANPNETDRTIMEKIEQFMQEGKPYTDNLFTVDILAKKLNMKNHDISRVINRCTNQNFSSFVNGYRIKEAMFLLSQKNAKRFSIDKIAFDAGFGDRANFHRVFKKMVGLSPVEFREKESEN